MLNQVKPSKIAVNQCSGIMTLKMRHCSTNRIKTIIARAWSININSVGYLCAFRY